MCALLCSPFFLSPLHDRCCWPRIVLAGNDVDRVLLVSPPLLPSLSENADDGPPCIQRRLNLSHQPFTSSLTQHKQERERLRRVVRQLNSRALILEATHCAVDLAHVLNTRRFDLDKVRGGAVNGRVLFFFGGGGVGGDRL